MAFEHITALHGVNAGRCAGQNEIAGTELEQPGEVGNLLRYGPDHLCEIAFLTPLTVHVQPNRTLCPDARS